MIAGTELRRLLRWRGNVFFLIVLPFLIILLLGAAFGGAESVRVGVLGGTDGPLARALVADLDAQPSTDVRRYGSLGSLERAVSRGLVDGGLEVPAGYDAALDAGKTVTLSLVRAARLRGAQQLRSTIQSLADAQARVLTPARLLAEQTHVALAHRARRGNQGRRRDAAARRPRREAGRERLRDDDGRHASRARRARSCCSSSSSTRSTAPPG